MANFVLVAMFETLQNLSHDGLDFQLRHSGGFPEQAG
jgi:hypothetical protein